MIKDDEGRSAPLPWVKYGYHKNPNRQLYISLSPARQGSQWEVISSDPVSLPASYQPLFGKEMQNPEDTLADKI